ncbi:MAG: hypothetical protein WCJ95_20710, partial [Mariniphaga sp.]
MIKVNVLLLTILFLVIITFSKQVNAQDADNYYTICKKWNTYYDANSHLKTIEDGDYMQFLRWQEFWRTRVNNGNANDNGKFSLYKDAMASYLKNKLYFNRSTNLIYSDWHCLGPFQSQKQDIGLVSAIYVDTVNDKTYNTVYTGTNSSGIWKTIDGGQNWQKLTDWNDFYIDGVNEIIGDPTNPNVLYAATGGGFMGENHPSYSAGIIKSSNRGQNWEQIFPVNKQSIQQVKGILLDPADSRHIFAIIDTAVWRTLDGGKNWLPIFKLCRVGDPKNIEKRYFRTLVMKPGDADTLYVATDDYHWNNSHQPQVWRIGHALDPDTSKIDRYQIDPVLPNNGDTIFSERFNVAVTPANPQAVYVACNTMKYDTADSTYHYKFKIWKYENGWTLVFLDSNHHQGIGYFKFEFQVSPKDENVLYYGGLGLCQLVKNQQGIWQIRRETLGDEGDIYHVDSRELKVIKGSNSGNQGQSDVIFAGNDGGISKSVDGISNWSNLNGNGLTITQFWGIGGANSIPYKIPCGSQDNSGRIFNNGNWNKFGTGDMGNIMVDFNRDTIMYGNCFGSNSTSIVKSTDGGISWHYTKDNISTEHRLANSPMQFNPGNPNSVFFGAEKLYRSDHGLDTLFPLTGFNLHQGACDSCYRDAIAAFCIAPSDTNRIYVVFDGIKWDSSKKFLRTTNGGQSWENLTDSVIVANQVGIFGNYTVSDLIVSPNDSLTLWMTLNGFWSPNGDKSRVIVSHNGGATFTNFSDGLPNMPVNCIRYMNGNNDRLLVGTDVGVFYRDNTLSEWQPFNTMLPTSVISDIEINASLNKVRA